MECVLELFQASLLVVLSLSNSAEDSCDVVLDSLVGHTRTQIVIGESLETNPVVTENPRQKEVLGPLEMQEQVRGQQIPEQKVIFDTAN